MIRLANSFQAAVAFTIVITVTVASSAATVAFNEVYVATYDACSKMPSETLIHQGLKWDDYWAGKFPSARMNSLLASLTRESFYAANEDFNFTQETGASFSLVHSMDFLSALDRCYPTDDAAKTHFIRLVKHRDKAGKTLAIAAQAVMLSVGAGTLLKLATVSRLTATAIGWGLTTVGGYGFYQLYRMRQESLAQCENNLGHENVGQCLQASLRDLADYILKSKSTEFTDSDVREFIRLEIEALKKRRAGASDPDEISRIDVMIDGELAIQANLQPK